MKLEVKLQSLRHVVINWMNKCGGCRHMCSVCARELCISLRRGVNIYGPI